jgi:hypothetical protein
VLIGFVAGLAVLAGAAGLLWLARQATGAGFGFIAQRPLLARFGLWETAMALAALAPILLAARLTRRRPEAAWLGLLLGGLFLGAVLQFAAPLAAYLIAWPLLAACAMAAATRLGGDRRPWALGLLAGLGGAALAWLAVYFHLIALALDMPPALALFAWLAALVVQPLLRPLPAWSWLVALLLMAALVAGLRFGDPWSTRHPRWAGQANNLRMNYPIAKLG